MTPSLDLQILRAELLDALERPVPESGPTASMLHLRAELARVERELLGEVEAAL